MRRSCNGDVPGSRPKGSFRWKSILKLKTTFKGIARAEIKDGRTVMLWHDLWDNNTRSSQFPELFSYSTSNGFTVAQATSLSNMYDIFQLPLFAEAFRTICELKSRPSRVKTGPGYRHMELYLGIFILLCLEGLPSPFWHSANSPGS
jgi:hypothetical protein